MDDGIVPVKDPDEIQQARLQARGVYLRSLLVAAAITVVLWLIP
ncbi:MAG TPA: hypothetical protein VG755_43705 [Nannocystaceae bacterium]|nr:hypothetical protein [Nannocystaceae bacterium]